MVEEKRECCTSNSRPSWREYQDSLNRSRHRGGRMRRLLIYLIPAVAAILIVAGLFSGQEDLTPPAKALPQQEAVQIDTLISKREVQLLLDHCDMNSLTSDQIVLPVKGHRFHLKTSLDVPLHTYLAQSLDKKNSRYIGIVVMDAETGRILALTGFNKEEPGINPCLRNNFPAASIFKIVTAAAAVEHCGYGTDTQLRFNGYKHTLYKRQLNDQVTKYSTTISLEDSFAQSVNPVFGKLGSLRLGKSVLEQYATAFGFNQPIDFELLIPPSKLTITDEPYHLAEIASGFNRETTLSPLHAAVMVSAILNEGQVRTPTIVESISDENGKILYRSQTGWQGRAITAQAAAALAKMMETTVLTGTGRKPFRGLKRDPILSQLQIGGKTGSIDNHSHDARFDWFVGFAEPKQGSGKLAVAVLVAHEKYIGIRAGQYARMAISHYFEKTLARGDKAPDHS